MKKISDKKYQEYLDLQKWKSRQEIEESLATTYNLEDDIDFPIRNSVAILALAGCTTMFSCCGFDYHGQPLHKSHQYGEPYIMLAKDETTQLALGNIYHRLPYGWELTANKREIFLKLKSVNNPYWSDPKVIHFSENLVISLNELERHLFTNLKDVFKKEVILEDTNKEHNKTLKYWQYPPKNPWVITLDSLTV